MLLSQPMSWDPSRSPRQFQVEDPCAMVFEGSRGLHTRRSSLTIAILCSVSNISVIIAEDPGDTYSSRNSQYPRWPPCCGSAMAEGSLRDGGANQRTEKRGGAKFSNGSVSASKLRLPCMLIACGAWRLCCRGNSNTAVVAASC